MTRRAGDHLVVGYGENVDVPTIDLVSAEINVLGNLVGSYDDLVDLMALAGQRKVTLHTAKYALEDFRSTTSTPAGSAVPPSSCRETPGGAERPLGPTGAAQAKMLTPPGPTNSPRTINTIPQTICLRTIATTPATTSTTARIQSRVAIIVPASPVEAAPRGADWILTLTRPPSLGIRTIVIRISSGTPGPGPPTEQLRSPTRADTPRGTTGTAQSAAGCWGQGASVGSQSRSSWVQRSCSSTSPIRPAAVASTVTQRRKPRFGSCDHGTGP